jgi:hypothetical protein
MALNRRDIVIMIKESTPTTPAAYQFPPKDGRAYAVRSGDSWASIAQSVGLDPWRLIEFNFPYIVTVTPFDEKCCQVNWLMRTHVGCTTSRDGTNYSFDSSDSPGWIYLPSDDGKLGFPEPVHLLEDLKRRRNLAFAKAVDFYEKGAHFILGARAKELEAGDVFGSGAAVWLGKPDLKPSEPSVLAAEALDGGGDRNICVGRFRHPDVKQDGGRKMKASEPELREYLDEMKALQAKKVPHARWYAFKRGWVALSPRTFFEDGSAVIVLGESCVGKIHVDCVSLVNACMKAGEFVKGRYSITQYMEGTAFGKPSVVMNKFKGDNKGPTAKTADIVIKHANHIGICGVDEKTGEITVIEATGAAEGVIKTKFRNTDSLDNSKWKVRVRPQV